MDSEHRVIDVTWRAPAIFELIAERDGLAFVPGDCVAAFNADLTESRPYSIASGQSEDQLRLLIRHMPGGILSTWLSERRPGDTIGLSKPFGWFRPGQSNGGNTSFVFIATGTGIAPFLSYLHSVDDQPPVQCLYGVRTFTDGVYIDFIRGKCPLTLAVSREAVDDCHHGRVTALLEQLPLNDSTHFYLCGLDAMIDESSEWLEDHGVDFANIHREVFFHASS